MKKVFYSCLTLALVALSACTSDEQTSFNFSDIHGKAVIKGNVTYRPGNVTNGNGTISQKEYANGAVVTVEVQNAQYVSGAEGSKTYSATTDENGNYSIEVPAGVKPIEATVSVKDYNGTYSEYKNNALLTITGVKYSTSDYPETVSDGKTVTKDLELNFSDKPEVRNRNLNAMLNGSVVVPAEKLDNSNSTLNFVSTTEALPNAKALLTFTNSSDDRKICYEMTTSADGKLSLAANLFDTWELSNTSVNVKVYGLAGNITHYYSHCSGGNWDTQTVPVYFMSNEKTCQLEEMNSKVACNFGKICLDFKTIGDKNDIKGIGNSIDIRDGVPYYNYSNPLGFMYK